MPIPKVSPKARSTHAEVRRQFSKPNKTTATDGRRAASTATVPVCRPVGPNTTYRVCGSKYIIGIIILHGHRSAATEGDFYGSNGFDDAAEFGVEAALCRRHTDSGGAGLWRGAR